MQIASRREKQVIQGVPGRFVLMSAGRNILNLGCGKTRIPGSVGVDSVAILGFADVVHDLNVLPYPFDSDWADEIHIYHVIEHLDRPLKVLDELHRILKKGGRLYLRAPHFSSVSAFGDITHKRPFAISSFDVYDKSNGLHFYTNVEYRILNKKIQYFCRSRRCLPLILRPVSFILDGLIGISPIFFERFWCYLVGGACEIQVEMEKI